MDTFTGVACAATSVEATDRPFRAGLCPCLDFRKQTRAASSGARSRGHGPAGSASRVTLQPDRSFNFCGPFAQGG